MRADEEADDEASTAMRIHSSFSSDCVGGRVGVPPPAEPPAAPPSLAVETCTISSGVAAARSSSPSHTGIGSAVESPMPTVWSVQPSSTPTRPPASGIVPRVSADTPASAGNAAPSTSSTWNGPCTRGGGAGAAAEPEASCRFSQAAASPAPPAEADASRAEAAAARCRRARRPGGKRGQTR